MDIQRLRLAIRWHRDQKGDDRCWLDDGLLWKELADTPPEPTALPPYEEMMRRGRAFYTFRRADNADTAAVEANLDPAAWDADLLGLADEALRIEYERLQNAIRTHRDIHDRERAIDDDRRLYSILPEQAPADFRLPKEANFLGEARAPHAGCPSFWRSHQSCTCEAHSIHAWGPCCKHM